MLLKGWLFVTYICEYSASNNEEKSFHYDIYTTYTVFYIFHIIRIHFFFIYFKYKLKLQSMFFSLAQSCFFSILGEKEMCTQLKGCCKLGGKSLNAQHKFYQWKWPQVNCWIWYMHWALHLMMWKFWYSSKV